MILLTYHYYIFWRLFFEHFIVLIHSNKWKIILILAIKFL